MNVVFGTGPKVGQALVSHPGISCVSFTGGTATGLRIAQIAAGKKISLEVQLDMNFVMNCYKLLFSHTAWRKKSRYHF